MAQADILIVDDDPNISKSIARALKPLDYKIRSVSSGQEALDLFAEVEFKVVISDVKMSRMDGFELLDAIHAAHPDTSRVVLSGHADVALILKLVNQKGIDRYLMKPWEPETLALTIANCIELFDLRLEAKKHSQPTSSPG